tara:strand:- start:383 stop:1594 length:1212 start_codon:yes stop_codon:yes gene_type:complete
MKKGILITVMFAMTNFVFAQSQNVTSSAILLKQYNSEKDKSIKSLKIAEAKDYIDLAYDNQSTSDDPKMWMYRAKIYKMISFYHSSLDSNAIFKATESHLKCMRPHPKKKNKIIIYKKWSKEDVLEGLLQCGNKLFNLGVDSYQKNNHSKALVYYNTIFDIIPYDNEGQLKRANITKETILYNSFFASNKLKDNVKSKKLLQELIDINFNQPAIYIHMSNIYIEEGNIDKAIEYLSLGREMFENDEGLINTEINLYIQIGRTSELIIKLNEAIELDPENDLLLFNRGTIYDQEGDFLNAEKDYRASLEINPQSFGTNYNLGALFFNLAIEQNNKANSTSNNSIYKNLKSKAESLFRKALPFLEKAYEIDPKDKNTLLSLKQLYYMNGDYKASEEMKKKIASLE